MATFATSDPAAALGDIVIRIRACRLCRDTSRRHLAARSTAVAAGLVDGAVAGGKPGAGIRVHETELPFNDPSGERLRGWMNLDRAKFYDASKTAVARLIA